MVRPDWVPQSVDVSVPSIARAYDFMLGGAHNFAVDREIALKIDKMMPGLRSGTRVNRAFLGRVVRFMVDQGVRQFLDIGSGIPTVANVHEVAQDADPTCRVVYVDRDPIAVAHSELMLADNDRAEIVAADLRDVDGVLGSPEAQRLLDFSQPVGMLMLLLLHWVPDEWKPRELLARYVDALPSGSFLAISHVSADTMGDPLYRAAEVINSSGSADQLTIRTHGEVLELLDGYELLDPGLVGCAEWRPTGPGDISDRHEINMLLYGAVCRKP
ncbi:SAM-dependent methyltransferase [Saccharothrix variisporea]|uniref:S-adenosyl methyltransferase n=1 Tax=Saccharothrix variisporea TaxID=543527 RepID=A0A495XEN9_9PSEU|nr:SAM-dependent methyltransferase [Saccharothrix variisporea]RKT72720.1 S-adenosyl methyltransferase [Saccharothrix variisporea]